MEYITLAKNGRDISGQRFARLLVLGPVGHNKRNDILWRCQCDCGTITTTVRRPLVSGMTKSCGCLNTETRSLKHRTHGMSDTPAYRTWCKMLERCLNPKIRHYEKYGGRGITICDEWRYSFEAFYFYVAQLPHFEEEGRSLDRINNDGSYEPGNVRWATRFEQARNRRSNHLLTHGGKTQCLTVWAEEVGISASSLEMRLSRLGWSIERALTTPPMVNHFLARDNSKGDANGD